MEDTRMKWSRSINHEFPLRSDLHAVLTLPADMTKDEAERLIRYIKTLATQTETSNG